MIQTVREKFSCRSCETITQPPAPFHPIARGRAGPDLLAMILHAKFGEHLPLNRQSESFAREGIDLDVSTLADWVGACTATLAPLVALIKPHVLAAERIHGDDTTVPVLAKGKTVTGRLWTYVRDDRPFGGPAPPAAIFYYSRDRSGEHPVPASGGLRRHPAGRRLCRVQRPLPRRDASPGRSSRRRVGRTAGASSSSWPMLAKAPLAIEAVRRIDAIFDIEREINGLPADAAPRRAPGSGSRRSSLTLEAWMRGERAQALAPRRCGQGDGLHAQALGRVHPLPR